MPQFQYLGTMPRQESNLSALARAAKSGASAFQASKERAYEREMGEREHGLAERRVEIGEGQLAEAVKGRGLESMRVGIQREQLDNQRRTLQESKRQFDVQVQEKKVEMQAKQQEEARKLKEKMAKDVEAEAIKLRTQQQKLQIEGMKLDGQAKRMELTALMGAFNNAVDAEDTAAANKIADAVYQRHGINVRLPQALIQKKTGEQRAMDAVERGVALPGMTMDETKKKAGIFIPEKVPGAGKRPPVISKAALEELKRLELKDPRFLEKLWPGMSKRQRAGVKKVEEQFKAQYKSGAGGGFSEADLVKEAME